MSEVVGHAKEVGEKGKAEVLEDGRQGGCKKERSGEGKDRGLRVEYLPKWLCPQNGNRSK